MADIVTIKFDPPREVRWVTDKAVGLYDPSKGWKQSLFWIPKLVIAGEIPKINSKIDSIRLQEWWADKWIT